MTAHNRSDGQFGRCFIDRYKVLSTAVKLFGKGRRRPQWIGKDGTISATKLKKALRGALAKKAAERFPFLYQGAYVKPLLDHKDSLVEQLIVADNLRHEPWTLEGLVGAVFDFDDRTNMTDSYHTDLSSQIQQFLAVISDMYRAFLRAPAISGSRHVRSWLPPIATFSYKADFLSPPFVPYTIPADETRQLFGGSVGVVVLPSTYRRHPVFWAALAHETGGHDILWAVNGLRRELEEGVFSLFESGTREPGVKATMRFREALIDIDKNKFGDTEKLGQLWRYWIGEAAADIFGILNMGPAFAINAALYSSILSKEIIGKLYEFEGNDALRSRARDMESRPSLRISPPPYDDPEDPAIDPHPPDILRLATMQGAIEKLQELGDNRKRTYLTMIDDIIAVCTPESDHNRQRVSINGYLQTGPDSWDTIDINIPGTDMIECAREVGRYIVMKKLETVDKVRVQELRTWTDANEERALAVREVLLGKKINQDNSINNLGDDAELLAGSTLALFGEPLNIKPLQYTDAMKRQFYKDLSDRLAEALQKSFFRDEVWGDTILAKAWQPR